MDKIDNLLKRIANNNGLFYYNKSESDHLSTLTRMESYGIISRDNKNTYKLTGKGWNIHESGLGWEEWEEKNKKLESIHIGHNIIGNVQESSLHIDNSRDKQITNNNTAQRRPNKSWLDWIVMIIGSIASIISIVWWINGLF